MNKIKALIEILRPWQWYKNLVIFFGIVFSQNLFVLDMLSKVIFGFILMSIFSGITYIVNDTVDMKKDRQHPEKRKRPLPSGKVSKGEAIALACVLFLISAYFSFSLNYLFGFGIIGFLLLGLAYSFFLKNIFLVDIITIGVNFTIRAALGVVMIGAYISPWLVLCTFLLALFLALGKRKGELNLLGKRAFRYKRVFKYYTNQLLDSLIVSTVTTLLISYFIYCIFHGSSAFIMTTIPVATFLLFKYLSIIFSRDFISESPEKIFSDKGMIMGMVLWVILILVSLYAF